MGFGEIWNLGFSSFEVFVGVGLIWLLIIETRIPDRGLSVVLMVVVAAAAAVAFFYRGWRKAKRRLLAAQAQMEAADAQYEDEIG